MDLVDKMDGVDRMIGRTLLPTIQHLTYNLW